ncbi:hypothetical protein V6N13_122140 [Hibiscus sabdariffa]|uniref:KIB1-4 beta-propeller domain-containing protein n=1 Tax=Hibiscus sabdariffa TaxID=183260 RepID=A0ABR2NQ50_9ROSI
MHTKSWEEIFSLDDHSLFLGSCSTFAVDGYSDCKPNCIYFTDDIFEYYETKTGNTDRRMKGKTKTEKRKKKMENGLFRCYCGDMFRYKKGLEDHTKTLHRKGIGGGFCAKCKLSFWEKKKHTIHVTNHRSDDD